ncbi:MAG: glycosyltransferase family 4 protein [Pseudorhizobium sp.]
MIRSGQRNGTNEQAVGEDLYDFVQVPEGAADELRALLDIPATVRPRIAFLAGPGDAAGSFEHWARREADPRTPVMAYSTMFYCLVERLNAQALVICEQSRLPDAQDPRFAFVSIDRPRTPGPVSYRRSEMAYGRRVLQALRDYRPHILLVGIDAPFWLMRFAPRYWRIVLTAHNALYPMGLAQKTPRQRLRGKLTAARLKRVEAGVCTSQEVARQVAEACPALAGKLWTEVPQVQHCHLRSSRQATGIKRIVYVGRLEEDKGPLDLLAAFEAVASQHQDLELIFAGGGSLAARLMQQVMQSPLRHRLHLAGVLDAQGVHDLLSTADLLVCPTRRAFSEGLALVAIEAAIQGVPTLLSSVVPAKQLLQGACVEFPADDAHALQTCMHDLIGDPGRVARLREDLTRRRHVHFDRSLSWGSQLCQALLALERAERCRSSGTRCLK